MNYKTNEKGVLEKFDNVREKYFSVPEGILVIGEYAFRCSDLFEIDLPESLETIGRFSFFSSSNLKKVKIPSLKNIDFSAFRNCGSLKEVELPNSVNFINSEAFAFCHSLEKINIPEGIKNIKSGTFSNCISLKEIEVAKSIQSIESSAFFNCLMLKSIDLPINLIDIGESAFGSCKNLENIDFSKTFLTEIGKEAFKDCSKIKKLKFPNSLVAIKEMAFKNCSNIEEIYLPDSLNEIGDDCFLNCNNIKKITINNYNNLSSNSIKNLEGYDYYLNEETKEIIMVKDEKLDLEKYRKLEYKKYLNEFMGKRDGIILSVMFSLEDFDKKEIKPIRPLLYFLSKENITKENLDDISNNLYNSKEFINLMKYVRGNFNSDENKTIMYDLFKLSYSLGAFDDNIVNRQKACEFIKHMYDKNYFSNDRIHGSFDTLRFKGFNKEWSEFLLNKKNLIELINLEVTETGFISRVYNNFFKIKEYGRSNRGNQSYRKVTVSMCKEYLDKVNFERVDDDNIDISEVIGKYTRKQEVFDEACEIRKKYIELKEANRIYDHLLKEKLMEKDIFTQIEEEKENIINHTRDALEILNDLSNKRFTYEFLSKYDARNFVLGKYCSCCAHLEGSGNGIMKASILHPDCQNLVIKNEEGKIIAKSTLYINRECGYGVFNNIEINNSVRDEDKILIYKKYIKAINDFANRYNELNKENPLTQINIGMGFNDLKNYIEQYNEKSDVKLRAVDFSLYGKGELNHQGDWQQNQYVIWKKKN